MADSNSAKAVYMADNSDIDPTHQDGSNDTMEVEDEAELMMKDSLEGGGLLARVSFSSFTLFYLLYGLD